MKVVALGPKLKKSWSGAVKSLRCASNRGAIDTYLCDSKADEFASSPQMYVVTGNNTKHETSDQETLNLNPATAEYFNEIYCEEVPGYVAGCSYDQVSVGVFEQGVIFGLALRKANGRKKYGLIKIGAIERNIDQEPG